MSGRKRNRRRSWSLCFLCCLWALLMGSVPESNAATVYVPDNYPNIQAAIDGVKAGDLIYVRANTYNEHLTISKSLTLRSVDGSDKTIINGRGANVVITISNTSKVSVIGFGIIKGGHTGDGGGVYIENSSAVILDQNAISGNSAKDGGGGGICAYHSGVRIKNNLIQSNSASYGGGLSLEACSGYVTGNTISGNSAASWDGGMRVTNSPKMLISQNTITDNTAQNVGGLMASHCNGVALRENVISKNTAQDGFGGLYVENSSSVVVDNNTISGNKAVTGWWGGAFFSYVDGQFINNKIQDNLASEGGVGGLTFRERCSGVVSGNTVSGNQARYYSAIWVDFSDMEIINNKIIDNISAEHNVFYVTGCPKVVIRGSTISRNTCKNGGGSGLAILDSSAVTVNGNIISFNSTTGGEGEGAGIYAGGSNITLSNNTILNNQGTSHGGGIRIWSCSGRVKGNTVLGNTAQYGAGMSVSNCFNLTIGNNIVKSNTAGDWTGGIHIAQSGIMTLEHNLVSYNTAAHGTGGVSVYDADATLKDNVIQYNSCGDSSGGVDINFSSVDLLNNIISNNKAGYNGGGVTVLSYSISNFINNTIVNNTAGNEGGGIDCSNYSSAKMINTILWENTPAKIQIRKDYSSTLTTSYCDLPGTYSGSNNIHLKPLFVGLGDYHLMSTSPCIGKGTATEAPLKDIDGQARPQGKGVDIGADEYKGTTVSILALTPSVGEKAANPGQFLISRADANVSAPLTVIYKAGGTAKPGVDYVPLSGKITIPATKHSVVLTVTPIDNAVKDGDRTVSVTLATGSYSIGSPGSDVLVIQDDEP